MVLLMLGPSGESGGRGRCEEELPFVLSPNQDQDLLLAAAYVSDAQYNRNVPFETSPQAIR